MHDVCDPSQRISDRTGNGDAGMSVVVGGALGGASYANSMDSSVLTDAVLCCCVEAFFKEVMISKILPFGTGALKWKINC